MKFFTCYGCRFDLAGMSPEGLLGELTARGFGVETPIVGSSPVGSFRFERAGDYVNLYHNELSVCQEQPVALAYELLVSRVHRAVISLCPDLTFLRADAVRWPDGSAILLPGSTFTGKTYLANSLKDAGATPWSAYHAPLDSEGSVLPYPLPVRPDESLSASAILHVAYRPGATWAPQSVTAGYMAMQLTSLLVGGDTDSILTALPILGSLAAKARVRLASERDRASAVVRSLQEELDRADSDGQRK